MSTVPPPPGWHPPPPPPSAPAHGGPPHSGPSARGEGPLETAVGVLTSPVATMRGLATEPHVGWAVVLTVVLGLLAAVESAGVAGSMQPVPFGPSDAPPAPPAQLRWVILVGGAFLAPLVFLGGLVVSSAILHGLALLFGGTGRYGSVFTTVGFAGIPRVFTVVGTLPTVTLGLAGQAISSVLGFGLFIWTVLLTVIAVRESHRLSTGKAVAVVLIPVGVGIALAILLFLLIMAVVIGGLGAAMGGASP